MHYPSKCRLRLLQCQATGLGPKQASLGALGVQPRHVIRMVQAPGNSSTASVGMHILMLSDVLIVALHSICVIAALLQCQPTRAGETGSIGCGGALRALVTLQGARKARNAARRALQDSSNAAELDVQLGD